MSARPGVLHHKAKLTEGDVRRIRQLRAAGLSFVGITERMGWKVSAATIEDVAKRKTWRHVK